ncbi:MAG: 2-amino-4-hydroxy-6-hydroxymethyldihydropteridine diphosphokinase, partial [Novosphingobium sp.]
MKHRYLIALGSNQRHARHGSPRRVLQAAVAALGGKVEAVSPLITSAPLGPSRRCYANAAAVVRSKREPDKMLAKLKRLERKFGRRRGGQRWGPRVLDLDIILWEGGMWSSPGLTVPHISFRSRRFVLGPAAAIAPGWHDPISGFSL